jgi:hypothetical protein
VRPRVAGRAAPLLRALEGLDAHVDAAHPAAPELWLAALAAPLLADAELPRKRGRPSQQDTELPDPGQSPSCDCVGPPNMALQA